MKSKLVLHQSALVFTCCTALTLLLINNEAQAQLDQGNQLPAPADEVLPKDLENILEKWAVESGKINKLEGSHTRYWYDDVFQVEKLSKGKFYYEQPDKGRIDITGEEVPKGAQGKKRNAKGQPYQLKPGDNERWICDGNRIFSINEDDKSYEVYPIPLGARGANIMEGPLPFLFGMPAAVAKKRYFLKLLEHSPQRIIIAVKPRRQSDAANYSEAKVMLDSNTYLPHAVQLIHPGGNQSTVYTFQDVVANKSRGLIGGLFGKDPFVPDLDKYRLQGKVPAVAENNNMERPIQNAQPVQQVTFKVPLMIGKDYKTAQKMLEQMGFKTKLLPGKPVTEAGQLKYHVYLQKPQAGTPAMKGELVQLVLYTEPKVGEE
ncbi:PASTA domain-containing protein [uncultured Gimesia sp.]|jgi:TIGR03009 family protein|uniref:PASTA domain-containing protein n=1 Tax=uncultured Gimesia sp. TaxID=1678688 RepID=UPI0026084240|nr:PASTA domain-containing protein [uncultured Gimesia sp.]